MQRFAWTMMLALLVATAARADDRTGATVSGTVAALDVSSRTDVAWIGAFGYRFNSVVGLELEITAAPKMGTRAFDDSLTPALNSVVGAQILPVPAYRNAKARAVVLTNNVRVNVPTTLTRIAPFFVAGGGVAQRRATAQYTFPIYLPAATGPLPTGTVLAGTPIPSYISRDVTQSSTDLALTLGGGVGFKVASHLWVDADLRLIRFLGATDDNAGRFGIGVRYAF